MYGKVFTSIWDGSLYGHLEATATLMALVTLCNAEGVVDMTHEAISGRTGWPIDFIRKGIAELEAPDERSRTHDEDGRRLARLDPNRDWGWLIVNYKKYREKKDLDVEREQSRERVRRFRQRNAVSRDVTHGNASLRQAEAEAEADIEAEAGRVRGADAPGDSPLPKKVNGKEPFDPVSIPGLDLPSWNRFLEYRSAIRKPYKPISLPSAARELAAFGADQPAVVEQTIAKGWTGLFALKHEGAQPGATRQRALRPEDLDALKEGGRVREG